MVTEKEVSINMNQRGLMDRIMRERCGKDLLDPAVHHLANWEKHQIP